VGGGARVESEDEVQVRMCVGCDLYEKYTERKGDNDVTKDRRHTGNHFTPEIFFFGGK
jgi:Zn ribbon nucleic-acid-binding protein